MTGDWLVLVESNTTGSGRLFCESARRLGLRPVVLARDPDRYPYVQADGIDSLVVDTAAAGPVQGACASLAGRIAGVTSSSEYFIGTAAAVARSLGLPHPDPDAVRRCRDKRAQRARLADCGLPGPRFSWAGSPGAAVAAAARIGLPVVIKPAAGSGSIGVRLCATPDEVDAAARYVLTADPAAIALPPQESVLVEQYLNGIEYSVEFLGEQAIGITRKHLGPEPYFVETGHDFPAPLRAADQAAIAGAALAALRALGLGQGGAHVELRQTAAGPFLIEINPRLAGGMIPRMVQEATGIDMIFHLVAGAAARGSVAQPSRQRAASIRFLVAAASGRLAEVTGLDRARRLPGVAEVGLTCKIGQEVLLSHSFRDRLGYVIAAAADVAAAARAAQAGVQALAARMDLIPVAAEGTPG